MLVQALDQQAAGSTQAVDADVQRRASRLVDRRGAAILDRREQAVADPAGGAVRITNAKSWEPASVNRQCAKSVLFSTLLGEPAATEPVPATQAAAGGAFTPQCERRYTRVG